MGVLVGLLSTSVQSIGLTLQRKSHLLEDEIEEEYIRRPPYRRRRWQVGMLMFIVANLVGSTIQITTLPLPVLSTLQASGLVFNTVCATLILSEPFTKLSLFGTLLVAAGAVLIALFGALPEPSHTLDQLLQLLKRPQFIGWMICTGLFMSTLLIIAVLSKRLLPHRKDFPRIRLLRGMSYGSISAILSAHSLLVAKSAVELIVRTIADRVNQFNRWQSWLILLSLLVLALTQLYFLHRGLKLVSTSILYPFVFCIYNIIAIIDGLIYFRQADRLPPSHGGLIALGTTILLAGVLALSWRLDDENSAARPPEAQNLLTPGMGMVEDVTTDFPGETTACSMLGSEDEEAAVDCERTPLLGNGHIRRPQTAEDLSRPSIRQRNQRYSADLGDIWAALQDDESSDASNPKASASRHPSSKLKYMCLDGDGDQSTSDQGEGLSPSNSLYTRRARTVAVTSPGSGSAEFKQLTKHKRRLWSRQYRSTSTPHMQQREQRPSLDSPQQPQRRAQSFGGMFMAWFRSQPEV